MSPETTAPIDGQRRRIRIPVWAFLLAVAVIITGLLLILLYRKHSGLSAQMTSYSITIPPGDRNRFQLPDGREVWLNAASWLKYEAYPKSHYAKVEIIGEAWFPARGGDSLRLFIHTHNVDVDATNASLDISAYPGDPNGKVSLFSGSALAFPTMQSALVELSPGDKLIVPALDPYCLDSTVYSPQDTTYAEIAWVKNDLCFRDATLPDLVPTLQRWYGIKIDLKGPDQLGRKFSAWMADKGLGRTLATLQQVQPFHYTIDDQEVRITP